MLCVCIVLCVCLCVYCCVAEKQNTEHMTRLLQLVLGIAVHCEEKESE